MLQDYFFYLIPTFRKVLRYLKTILLNNFLFIDRGLHKMAEKLIPTVICRARWYALFFVKQSKLLLKHIFLAAKEKKMSRQKKKCLGNENVSRQKTKPQGKGQNLTERVKNLNKKDLGTSQ